MGIRPEERASWFLVTPGPHPQGSGVPVAQKRVETLEVREELYSLSSSLPAGKALKRHLPREGTQRMWDSEPGCVVDMSNISRTRASHTPGALRGPDRDVSRAHGGDESVRDHPAREGGSRDSPPRSFCVFLFFF